ncbi:MAG TPA: MerR family transcriptional regulator [Ktedonobacteraceae bacterium]|nr:MerR family transcriptional regulator [Ktedonobacteraceae bacterium]
MEELTIGDVARKTGLRTSAIRYYEDVGILPRPKREHGHRRYTPRILQQIAVIQVAQQAGFTIAEIQRLFAGFDEQAPLGARWRTLAEQKIVEVESLIIKAQGMKRLLEDGMRCDCLTLDECFPLAE